MKKTKRMSLKRAAAAFLSAGMMLTMPMYTAPLQFTAFADGEAQYVQNDTMTYYKYDDHVEIYNCSSNQTSFEIPETIEGLPVTAIAMYGFQCSKLETLTVPDSITVIGDYAFSMSSDLKSVKLPDSLEVIGMHTFEYCVKLDTVEYPDKMIEVRSKAFDSTPWLEALRKKDPLVIVGGSLIDGRTAEGAVEIPDSVGYVASSAFAGIPNLESCKVTSCVFPKTVKVLKDNTFFYAEDLTSLDIRSVTEIGSMALCGCNKLTDLKLSNKLTKIDSYAFSDNTSTCTITFYGTEEEWNKVEKPSDSEFLKKAKIIFADAPEEPEEVIGDVNMDGKFDTNDIVLVQKWILAIPGTTMKNPKAADFTKDDVIDIYDLGLMKHELLKKKS